MDRLKPVAPLPSTNKLNLVLGLPLRNQEALVGLLHNLYNPASPAYHKFLTPGEFAERFGPSVGDYQEVARFATSHGLTVTGTSPNRTMLDIQGSVENLEKTFHVRMGVYQHPTEARTFHAPDADPSFDLAVPLLAIHGLDDFALPRPASLHADFDTTNMVTNAFGSGPNGYYLGYDFRAAYAPGVALTGAGQAVGLFEMDGYYPSDIAEYESLAKLPNVLLTNVFLDGVNGSPAQASIEVTLDIDMTICMAPGLSEVIVYEGTNPDDILNRMATDNRAHQLSCSWDHFAYPDATREQIYEQFAAQGQTMFQSSGDNGAYPPGAFISPTDDPNVTVVGGTVLTTSGPGGPWSGEAAWGGSGGGASPNYPLPAWQQGLATPANQGSTMNRNFPDVAAEADDAIWLIAYDGQQGVVGGTSAATPLWAGFLALANQQAAAHGQPPIGFINAALYAIGRSAGYSAALHDITVGNNTNENSPSNYFATTGYDLCTGWGSPAGSNLINALISLPDPLQIFPPVNLTATGGTGGTFNPAAQNMVLTNIGTNALNWAAASAAPWLSVAPGGGLLPAGRFTTVALNLNATASNLTPGNYAATVWFTNLNDGFVQNRQLTLDVLPASSVPLIVNQPVSQTALPGASVIFAVTAVGNAPLSYQWQHNAVNLSDGGNISGASSGTLTINDISSASVGTYFVIVSNSLNSVTSSGAVLDLDPITSPGVSISNLYSFAGANDGGNPNGLMQATNGEFYGTTQTGGAYSVGTVFQVTSGGVLTTLYPFDAADNGGVFPQAGLTQGTDGNLYGTTVEGGANGYGTIFKTTANGNLTTVYTFDGGNGENPDATMILGSDGNFYGTTSSGGMEGSGEVFRLTTAGALSQLASFDYTDGYNPNKLSQGADGSFYGTTFNGGANGDGVTFNVTTNGALTTLFSFSSTNGGFLPTAGLVQAPGGTFYGTTYEGGAFGFGTLFSMSSSGLVTTLYSFTGGADGGHPSAELIQASDGNFYGPTADGGTSDDGTVFRWAPGGALVTLASFDGYNGANPETPLVQGADGSFYGTTLNGGATGNGVIYRISFNSPTVQITGQPVGQDAFFGANAVFSVAATGNPPLLYQWWKGETALSDGGNISGSSTRVLTVSDVSLSDAAVYSVTVSNATGSSAVSEGAFLEVSASPPQILSPLSNQTASVGGVVLFEVAAVGSLPLSYQWQSNQVNLTNNANVSGVTTSSLTLSGLTQRSDATYSVIVSNDLGLATTEATLTVYPASLPGTTIESLHWFTGGPDGGVPNGLILGSNGVLYGTTQSGGANNDGTVFSLTTNGVFKTLVTFASTNGSNPQAALTQGANGNFYGTTQLGGADSFGTVFTMTTNGKLTTLASFNNVNSIEPYTALVQGTNGNFYGATKNALQAGDGNIFEMTPSGTVNVIYSFTGGLDGNEPIGALAQDSDGNFYGLTTAGGADTYGGVFKMTPAGVLTNIYSFTGGSDGYNPYGALIQATDGFFYGVTRRDVYDNLPFDGTIFKVSTNGVFSTVYTLNPLGNGDGEYPFAGLIQGADGNLYGTTLYSEAATDGTIFRVTTAGTYTTLTVFNGTDDGAQPKAAMVQDAAGNLYGTTTSGGPYGQGTIFRLSMTSAPQITAPPSNQTVFAGAAVQFEVSVFGASPLSYQWQKNAADLADDGRITGSATRVLDVNNITTADAGTYSVIVSNAFGSVTSPGAILTVVGPPVFQAATLGDGKITLTWSAASGQSYQVQSTANLSTAWANLGGALTASNSTLGASFDLGSSVQQFYRVLLVP